MSLLLQAGQTITVKDVSTTTPIYIGDTPLGEDEYVSFEEQKVYRRTENLWNFDESAQGDGYVANQLLISTGVISTNEFFISEYIPVVAGQTYTYFTDLFRTSRGVIKYYNLDGGSVTYVNYTQQKSMLNRKSYSSSGCASFTVPTNTEKTITHMRISIDKGATMFFIVEGSTAPSTYIPYLQPTDPPVPLPALPTCDGTTIIDYARTPKPSQMYVKYSSRSGWEPCAVKRYHISKNKFDESQAEIISTANGDFYGVNMGILTGDYTFGAAMAAGSTLYVQHGYTTDTFTYPSDSMFISPYQFGDGEPVKIYTNSTTQTTFADEGITRIMMNKGENETHYEPYGVMIWDDCTEYVRRNGVWVQQTAPALSQQSLSPQMSLDVQPIQSPSQTMGADEPIALETDVTDNSGGGNI